MNAARSEVMTSEVISHLPRVPESMRTAHPKMVPLSGNIKGLLAGFDIVILKRVTLVVSVPPPIDDGRGCFPLQQLAHLVHVRHGSVTGGQRAGRQIKKYKEGHGCRTGRAGTPPGSGIADPSVGIDCMDHRPQCMDRMRCFGPIHLGGDVRCWLLPALACDHADLYGGGLPLVGSRNDLISPPRPWHAAPALCWGNA